MRDSGTRQLRNVLEISEIANAAPDCAVLGRDVLDALAKSLGVEKCVFIIQRTGWDSPEFFYRGIGQTDADRYQSYYYSEDPLRLLSKVSDHLEVSLHIKPNKTVSLEEAVSYDDFVGSRYYQEFFQPQGISHEIATHLEASPRVRAVIDLLRSPKEPPFSVLDIRMMDRLAPHLSRALDVIEMRRDLQIKSSALEEYEARSSEGLLLCDDQMRIIYANERGTELLAPFMGRSFGERLPDFFQVHVASYLAAALKLPEGELPPPLEREVHLASESYQLVCNETRRLDGFPRRTGVSVLISRLGRKAGDLTSTLYGSPSAGAPEPEGSIVPDADGQEPLPLEARVPTDDRDDLLQGDPVLLVAEDDPAFAHILVDLGREQGFKVVVARGGEEALELARSLHPRAISLDLRLPELDGWSVLDRLKLDPSTRHIPVHIISVEEERGRGLRRGAFAFSTKPVTKQNVQEGLARMAEFLGRPKRLLVVEAEDDERSRILELIGDGDLIPTVAASADEALGYLRQGEPFDCMVVNPRLPGKSGLELLGGLLADPALAELPVVVHSTKSLTKKEKAELKKLSQQMVVKEVHSPERLLDETALFLHRVPADLPEDKRQVLEEIYKGDSVLTGKKILVVDDDIRNIFAVTSMLQTHGIVTLYAENGRDALERLKENAEVAAVLMDIMMPEMDGYETTRAIRSLGKFKQLPVIALTAKAMKGDREKCIEAGCSDYITKPVDTDQLLSLLRVWLYP